MVTYDSSAIEVLTGLEPVRKRPGMYTFTDRPDHLAQEGIDNAADEAIAGHCDQDLAPLPARPAHLAQEVIDNAADEAIAGHCDQILVTLHDDGSLSVADNGRGMPVDLHKEEKVPGVEVILTRLHSGAKFSDKSYTFSGGLHGVGVSVVNALSTRLDVWVRREGKEHHMAFADGQKVSDLQVVNTVGMRNTGTTVRFWPDANFFADRKSGSA